MSKKIKGSYLLNAVGVALVFALLTGLFAANAFGTSTTYIQGICTTACYTIIMVTSLNLVVGFMGEFSLGHAGFVSVGAYVSAIVSGALAGKGLSDLGLFLIALLVGGLAAGIMGVLVGIPALRLRGDYLAIVTMAFAEIIRVCFCNFSITGGGKTMSGILKLSTFPRVFWIMVVCVTIMYLFVRSKYGRTVQAIFRTKAYWQQEAAATARAKELLQVVHLSGKEDLEADNLPYGEQRRLEIARADENTRKTMLYRVSERVYDGSIIPPESGNFISDENLFNYQAKVLRELLNEESYICVGRAADFVLRDKPNVLTVYVDAPYDWRVEREMKRQGIGSSQAKHYIDKLDRYRESYYKYHTGRQWKRVENYDLCLDSAAIGLDNCVELIKKVIELKFDVKAK